MAASCILWEHKRKGCYCNNAQKKSFLSLAMATWNQQDMARIVWHKIKKAYRLKIYTKNAIIRVDQIAHGLDYLPKGFWVAQQLMSLVICVEWHGNQLLQGDSSVRDPRSGDTQEEERQQQWRHRRRRRRPRHSEHPLLRDQDGQRRLLRRWVRQSERVTHQICSTLLMHIKNGSCPLTEF